MLWLSELKKTRFYQEAFEEGYREGFNLVLELVHQQGKLEARVRNDTQATATGVKPGGNSRVVSALSLKRSDEHPSSSPKSYQLQYSQPPGKKLSSRDGV